MTVVLIGAEISKRKYVSYEMEKERCWRKFVFWVFVSMTQKIRTDVRILPDPFLRSLVKTDALTYMWEYGTLGEWVGKGVPGDILEVRGPWSGYPGSSVTLAAARLALGGSQQRRTVGLFSLLSGSMCLGARTGACCAKSACSGTSTTTFAGRKVIR